MDNREALNTLLDSYCRKQKALSGSADLKGKLQDKVIEDICEGYISTFGDDPRKSEIKEQYVSFLTEAAPIVNDQELKFVSGLGGGAISGLVSIVSAGYIGGVAPVFVLGIVGGALGAIGGYKWGEQVLWNKPVKLLIEDYTKRLDRLDEQSAVAEVNQGVNKR